MKDLFCLFTRVSHPKSSRPVRSYEPSNRSAKQINENQNKEFDKENGKENDFEKAKAEFDKFDKNMKDAHKELKQGMENLFKETFESDKIRKDAQKEAKQTMEKLVGKEMANKLDKEVDKVSNIVLVPNYYSKSKKQSKPVIGRAFVYPVSFSETQNTQVGVLHVPDLRKFTEQLRNKEIEIPVILFGIMFGLPLLLTFRLTRKIDIKEMFSIGQRIRIVDPTSKEGKKNLKIKFRDVAGLHEAKREVMEIVDYLRKPQKYVQLGARLPKGALLTGPPGCGKTLLAKALAAESSVPFINVNGTEFVEMIGGLGASRVRKLFKKAKSSAPCIIYIDEIDALGRKRQNQSSGNDEMEQTLNQLLVEMDGMDSNKGVVVVGSTNRVDMLDKALLRPGRFDRHITIDLPTLLERKELFDLYLQKIKKENLLTGVSHRLAQMTPGFSGADIKNVVNEAAIHAATAQKKMVKIADIDFALQKIVAGPEKRSRVLIKEEREIVAFHESGHALVGWLLEHTEALLRVTIIPRTSAALGFAQYSPKDRKLFTKEELFDRMCMMLGGRVAENVIFGKITTGAQNDLEKVTKQAQAMIKWYGMSELIGPISFFPGADADLRSADFTEKPYSKKLGNMIDQEIGKLVADAYYSTENLLRENKDKLEVIAKALLERETLNYEDVKRNIWVPFAYKLTLVYLCIVYFGQKWMATRRAVDNGTMNVVLALWNFGFSFFSGYAAWCLLPELLHVIERRGFIGSYCDNANYYTDPITGFWGWMFVMSKAPELGDTLFLILRKRPVIFLHWYHHALTFIYATITYAERQAWCRWSLALNLTVHTIMYFYFGLQALKVKTPRLFAKFITSIQILQFVISCYIFVQLLRIKSANNIRCDA
uniref:AAA+ ATPase domain-containing protein n=1 Tax=Meloidogyne javanica TaxID=6303 RepID=A0A915LKD0_MELJA